MMNDELTASHSPPSPFRLPPSAWPLAINALALVLAAVWLRGYCLGNIPGVNGDEAWYGVEAWQMLHDANVSWHTPTGNPLNPLFMGPLALLHLWFPPSVVLLRSMALASGLAALAVNWLLCRWVFDRRTAAISTVALAILPMNIAYSRFAWDASQSLMITLPVLYLALGAVRYPDRFSQWISASILALAVAFWVHPTNAFVGAVIAVACIARCWGATADSSSSAGNTVGQANRGARHFTSAGPLILLAAAGLLVAGWFGTSDWTRGPLSGRLAERLSNLRELTQPSNWLPVSALYARLFTGGTIYRYMAGSRSWFEWPSQAECQDGGLDVALFWVCVLGSIWLLWKRGLPPSDSRLRLRTTPDRVLFFSWVLELAAFLLVAGPRAMVPEQERFTICLIGPTVLLMARGATLAWEMASMRGRMVLVVASLAGWLVLADFHAHYFRFIEQTGGQSHLTFRTAEVEPKQAALQYIVEEGGRRRAEGGTEKAKVWIVCSEWWNRWPIRYLALPHRNIYVPEPNALDASDDYRRALSDGRVWFIEFCNSPAERRAESELAGREVLRRQFVDYGGRPLLSVLHAVR